jgi:hypothetical protein
VISVPSSTTSFDRPLLEMPWLHIFGIAFLFLIALVLFLEIRLAELGYVPTIVDSKERWSHERLRASELGEKALILIGSSRIQVDTDLRALRRETSLEPVQLAIDGSSFLPVLADLASDPTIRGTIIVDYYDHFVASPDQPDAASQYVDYFRTHQFMRSELAIENFLADALHTSFRSYADGATPLMSLALRVFEKRPDTQYFVTLPDRSRLADYHKTKMPEFYYGRVMRNLGLDLDPESSGIEQTLKYHIAQLRPESNHRLIVKTTAIRHLATAIVQRGGRAFFVAMPSTGMVRQIEDRKYPRKLFFDEFSRKVGVPTLRTSDVPILRDFACPDGSHLDYRDREVFTTKLVSTLDLGKGSGNKPEHR